MESPEAFTYGRVAEGLWLMKFPNEYMKLQVGKRLVTVFKALHCIHKVKDNSLVKSKTKGFYLHAFKT